MLGCLRPLLVLAIFPALHLAEPSLSSVDRAPPRVTVDLGKDPEHRWDDIVAARKDIYVHSIETVLATPTVKSILPLARKLIGNDFVARRLLPGDLLAEAKGIARGLGMDIADVIIISVFYDLFAAGDSGKLGHEKACTGVVAQSESGEIIHGRNLDYDFRDALGNSTIIVDFVKPNSTEIAFTAVTFGPCPTFNTAVRYGSFSLTHNQRDAGSILANFWDILVRGRPAVFARIRQAMETITTFEDAVNEFRTVDLDAPSYFILGGTKEGEGAVITRARDASALHDIMRLDAAAGHWYVVETNYDHEKQPGPGDQRRVVLQRTLNATGQKGISTSSMWDVISVQKVNKTAGERAPYNDETIYSTVMQASNPKTFKTLVRGHLKESAPVLQATPVVV